MIGPAELEDIRLDLEAAKLEREAAIIATKIVDADESESAPPLEGKSIRSPAKP